MRKSCLVDERMIFEALEAQALLAEKESDMRFSKKRKVLLPGFTVSGAGLGVVNGFLWKGWRAWRFPKIYEQMLMARRGENIVYILI